MIFGIGTDIVSYSRIFSLHEKYGERFAQRVLSKTEMPGYTASVDPARFLMKRFAANSILQSLYGA